MSFRASHAVSSGPARSRSRLAVVCLALATPGLAGCGDEQSDPLAPATMSEARATPGATFDWSVPARFGHVNALGLIDYPTPEEIAQTAWQVDFDACALPGDTYTWHVDRRPVARVDGCKYTHEFAAEGTYQVALHVVSTRGSAVWAEAEVTVQDWLIVSIGDSYASGEGAPEVPVASEALQAEILGLFQDLQEAQQQLELARTSLEDAVEEKGLADQIRATRAARRAAFLNACTINEFKDIKECADFLAGLPFSTYNDAKANFDQAVENAQERVDDAIAAIAAAQAAIAAGQSAVESLTAAIEAAQGNFTVPWWQPKFEVEETELFECHRSALAAPARAALALEEADPRTSVTFVHLACSGAKTKGGLASVDAQIRWANRLIGEREVDAVLLSVGGNDVGFSGLATACGVQEPCFADDPAIDLGDVVAACAPLSFLTAGEACLDFFTENVPDESGKQMLADGLAALPGAYALIADESLPRLRGLLEPRSGGHPVRGNRRPLPEDDRLRTERVYLVEYSDMTKDDSGAYCGGVAGDPFASMPGLSVAEMKWLDENALVRINEAGVAAAVEHGWSYVTGVAAGFANRGYCARSHWMVRLPESLLSQGDYLGTGHPNRRGNAFTGTVIHEALMGDLYSEGLDSPRSPDGPQAKVIAGRGRVR